MSNVTTLLRQKLVRRMYAAAPSRFTGPHFEHLQLKPMRFMRSIPLICALVGLSLGMQGCDVAYMVVKSGYGKGRPPPTTCKSFGGGLSDEVRRGDRERIRSALRHETSEGRADYILHLVTLEAALYCNQPAIVDDVLASGFRLDENYRPLGYALPRIANIADAAMLEHIVSLTNPNLDVRTTDQQQTALHSLACNSGDRVENISVLLAHGANRDLLDAGNQTPLSRARACKNRHAIDLLTREKPRR